MTAPGSRVSRVEALDHTGGVLAALGSAGPMSPPSPPPSSFSSAERMLSPRKKKRDRSYGTFGSSSPRVVGCTKASPATGGGSAGGPRPAVTSSSSLAGGGGSRVQELVGMSLAGPVSLCFAAAVPPAEPSSVPSSVAAAAVGSLVEGLSDAATAAMSNGPVPAAGGVSRRRTRSASNADAAAAEGGGGGANPAKRRRVLPSASPAEDMEFADKDGAKSRGGGSRVVGLSEALEGSPSVLTTSRASAGDGDGARLSDAVDRILCASEAREAASAEFDDGTLDRDGGGADAAPGGGPLTAKEIGQLGLLCASLAPPPPASSTQAVAAAPPAGSPARARPQSEPPDVADGGDGDEEGAGPAGEGWAAVDGDALASLASLLERHVRGAAAVDLIGGTAALVGGGGGVTVDAWLHPPHRGQSVPADDPLCAGAGHLRLSSLRSGLEAASVLLSMMTYPGVDPRAVGEDAIEACVSLLRYHLSRNVVPSLEGSGHLTASASASGGGGGGGATAMDDDAVSVSHTPRKKKRSRLSAADKAELPSNHQEMLRAMKKTYRHVLSTVGLLSILMERVETLVRTVQLDDQPLLSICSASLSTLAVEPAPQSQCDNAPALSHLVQTDAMALVTAVFRRYPRHRPIVIEDLFPLMLRLPTSKRGLRTYPVRTAGDGGAAVSATASPGAPGTAAGGGGGRGRAAPQAALVPSARSPAPKSHGGVVSAANGGAGTCAGAGAAGGTQQQHVQMIAALVLQLVQGCVVMPMHVADHHDGDSDEDGGGAAAAKRNGTSDRLLPRLSSGLRGCRPVVELFVSEFAKRCSRKGEEGGASEFRPILSNLVEDLLTLRMMPEFPAADAVLVAFCRRLSHDLLGCSSLGGNRSSKMAAESTYLSTAADTLGKICADIASNLLRHREDPFSLPSAAELDDDGDGNGGTMDDEVCRCPCGRANLVDTFMLDCDRCHGWFHGSCVGIAKDRLPDRWMCDGCRVARFVGEQTRKLSARCARRGGGGRGRGRRNNGDGGDDGDDDDDDDDDENDQGDGPPHSPLPAEDAGHVLRQLLVHALTPPPSPSSASAREYHLARWIEELDRSRDSPDRGEGGFDAALMCAHVLEQWHCRGEGGGDAPGGGPGSGSRLDPSAGGGNGDGGGRLSEAGTARLMATLAATTSGLSAAFPRLLGVLIGLMSDEGHVALRKLAVKAISQIVQVDTKLMIQPEVRRAVSTRFHDDAISVREAAIGLVGSFCLQQPAVANAFHKSLLEKLADPGISVRKRSVKIFRDILVTNPNYEGRATALACLVQRAADRKEDDGVRDLIHETFQALWFEPRPPAPAAPAAAPGSARNHHATTVTPDAPPGVGGGGGGGGLALPQDQSSSSSSPVPTTNGQRRGGSRRGGGRAAKADDKGAPSGSGGAIGNTNGGGEKDPSSAAARQMVEVVAWSGSPDFLCKCVRELLFGLGEADKDKKAAERRKRRAVARGRCDAIVSALVEQLLLFEERSGALDRDRAGRELAAIVSTVGVFAEASPALLVEHLDVLLPYLKADNGLRREDEAVVVSEVSRILGRVAPMLSTVHMRRVSEGAVTDDLVRVTYNFGSGAVSAAVEALVRLASHGDAGSRQRDRLLGLARTFFGFLHKARNVDIAREKKIRGNVHRALSALGSICRFQKDLGMADDAAAAAAEDEDGLDLSGLIDPRETELTWSNLPGACYAMFSLFLRKDDVPTQCQSLRAMSGIFTARPRIMLAVEQTGIISELMGDGSHIDVRLEALRCWREILILEERRVESGEAKAKMESDESITLSKRISGDQDGDSCLIGGVLTQHYLRFYEMVVSKEMKIRSATIDLIEILLRQGLINPIQTMPYLLALQSDIAAPDIRSKALKLLIHEGEKRPDMLRQRVRAGVRQAYLFQRSVYPGSPPTAVLRRPKPDGGGTEVECIFDRVFRESIRSSRVQRHGLYQSLLGLFENIGGGNDDVTGGDGKQEHQQEQGKAGGVGMGMGMGVVGPPKRKKQANFVELLPLLSFAAQILAHLPYNNARDPLFIVYFCNSYIVHGEQLCDRFADFLRPHGLAGDDELDSSVDAEDDLEKAARAKTPSKAKVAAPLSKPGFDLRAFAELCAEGSALVLLLRLRDFLKKVYHLSEQRIAGFLPVGQKETIADRGTNTNVTSVFDGTVRGCTEDGRGKGKKGKGKGKGSSISVDALVVQYAEFRSRIRAAHAHQEEREGPSSGGGGGRKSKKSGGGGSSDDDDHDDESGPEENEAE